MKPFTKGFLLVSASIILLVIALFLFFFETPAGFKLMLRAVVPAKQLPEFSVEKVRTFPLRWMELSNVRATVILDGNKTEVNADGAGFQMHPSNPFKPPIFWIENLNIKMREISISGVEFKIGFEPAQAVPAGFGLISIGNLSVKSKYALRDIRGIITSLDPIVLRPIEGKFLDGSVKAEITYRPKDGSLAVKGILTDADMAQFGKIAGDQFRNSSGRFQTEFGFETEKQGFKTVFIKAESLGAGGEMNADLFRIFLDYLPSNADKNQINGIVGSKNTVPFDTACFTLKNVSEKSFQGTFNFYSRAMNIKLNLDLDVNFDNVEMMNSLAKILDLLGRIQNENG